ncbi:MAG: peptidylprolyl isomerase [Bacteroidales bacterium]|nr:MAG: peptidylprolyl isomerase [Bacteroidales bacterium]
MKTNRLFLILCFPFLFSIFFDCSTSKKEKDRFVLIETTLGDIKVRLYNDTPLHRDNFIKLVKERFYNGQNFHRVIREFMIQAGDPATTATSGNDREIPEIKYTIPAEFNPHHFHKKGALAAARMGDDVNPDQESSGSQFYIVQGKVFDESELEQIEKRINSMRKQSIFFKNINLEKEKAFEKDKPLDYAKIQQAATLKTEEQLKNYTPYRIPDDQRTVYKSIGGTPHLDGSYTVFGEVVEGLEVIDKIAAVSTDNNDKPLEEIRFTMKTVRR